MTPPIGAVKLKGWAEYLIIIRERWLLALTLSVSIPCLFFYYQIQKPKIYSSSAFLIVEPSADRVVNIEEVVNLNTLDEDVMQVHFSQLNSSIFKNFVFKSFTDAELEQLIEPYLEEESVILKNRKAQQVKTCWVYLSVSPIGLASLILSAPR